MDSITRRGSVWTKLRYGLRRRCPSCGEGPLFHGYLKIEDQCPVCGAQNGRYPSDDAAPYFTIFLVGHILVPLALKTHLLLPNVSVETELAIWLPVALVMTLALLPFVKGGVIGVASHFGVTRPSDEEPDFVVPQRVVKGQDRR